ncbi:MAG: flagellar biosynthetic protein FliQ [Acidobacteriota bacterium]
MESQILNLTQQGIWITVLVSAPPILAAVAVGLGLAVIQALTQIQEQTAQTALKIGVVFAVLMVGGYWMGAQVYAFGQLIFTHFSTWVG